MANKKIFRGSKTSVHNLPVANTVNKAGGKAFDLGSEGALAQYVVTGCLNSTFYAGAEEQVDKILELAGKCSTEFVAKTAVYAHETAKMKDTPALLLNVLANRGEEGISYLRLAFPRVMTNAKMLRNFVQILRSGKCGRKSMGTAIRNLIREWLTSRRSDTLLRDSVGNDPSLADVVRMVHPKPESVEKEAFYAWLLDNKRKLEEKSRYFSPLLKQYEDFKAGRTCELPNVEFRMLTALPLSEKQWTDIALNSSWNQLRMNLNTFERHGVFKDFSVVCRLADKLADKEQVRKNNVFPYQLLTTYQNTLGTVPVQLTNALQEAMEHATLNVPSLNGAVAVCVDTSGSMSSPITGHRTGATTKTRCIDVAALFGASLLRKNKDAIVLPFDTRVHPCNLNAFDSVMTNAGRLATYGGGGTSCESALLELNRRNWVGNAVIFISDNESWARCHAYYPLGYGYGGSTGMMQAWQTLKARKGNSNTKLVCIDIQPGSTSQVNDAKDRLNIGGFADSVFTVVENFLNHDSRDFSTVINDAVCF